MKVGIDISMMVYVGSGVAVFTQHFVHALLKYFPQHSYHLLYSSLRRPDNFYYLDEFKKQGAIVHDLPFPPRLLEYAWNKYHLVPAELFTGKVDIFHSSDFLRPPLFKGTKGVTTLFDLTWKKHPEWHTSKIIQAHSRKIEKTISYQDAVIVPSLSTKTDLLTEYPQFKGCDLKVIPAGIDDRFSPDTQLTPKKVNQVLHKYQLDLQQPYVLYVGAIEPRKNLIRVIEAFDVLRKKVDYDIRLVLAGRAGWKNSQVFKRIEQLNLQGAVVTTGFVEDDDLPHLYRSAAATIYLSLYEGFGLPPLESLACGTPVVALKNSSLPEIIEDQFLVSDDTPDLVASRLLKFLKQKPAIDARGIKDRFSWKQTAHQYMSFFEELV